jgi:hypothetical protein
MTHWVDQESWPNRRTGNRHHRAPTDHDRAVFRTQLLAIVAIICTVAVGGGLALHELSRSSPRSTDQQGTCWQKSTDLGQYL